VAGTSSDNSPRGDGVPGILLVLVVFFFGVGIVSTVSWFRPEGVARVDGALLSIPALVSLIACVALTSVNLFARWFRWHFLLRRFSREFLTRESFMVFVATLPAIATPFYLGELLRIALLRKKVGGSPSLLFRIWVAERLLDAGVLATFYFLALGAGWKALASLIFGSILLFQIALFGKGQRNVLLATLIAVPTSLIAWSLPIFALKLCIGLLGTQSVSLAIASQAFSSATLYGGVAGLPLGISLVGSRMIDMLATSGVLTSTAIASVLIHRAGTVWFAIVTGLGAFLLFRKQLAGLLGAHPESHFDEIVDEYTEEIPEHVRARLLSKKADYIQAYLVRAGAGRHGLDLGCGQGWYAAELTERGLLIDGVDYSVGQIQRAQAHMKKQGSTSGRFLQADARELPFLDNSFDFSYSINAMHHITSADDQVKALKEVVRVLQPGGVFLLNEMNCENPLFRLYMGYVFPLIKKIDEGNEAWILPSALPDIPGAHWRTDTDYFTFLPDFIPQRIQSWLGGVESWLEHSRFRRYSAHYQACLVKDAEEPQNS
jgi:SAM-dependent methyltransferase